MNKIGVVILNYIEYGITIDCINSFCRQTDDNINVKIIVVDNSSPNESFDVLQNEFKDNLNISVVKTPKNLGFANGNNYGYNILKEYMDPDFVIFSNSDIILPVNGLYKWILQCKNDYNFAVLGPSIYSINGDFYQNPIRSLTTNKKDIEHMIFDLYKSLFKIRIKILFRKKGKGNHIEKWGNTEYGKFHDDLTLHGAFQIMSKEYFNKYKEAYDTGTFLYMEEDILRLRCIKSNLRMIYSPDFIVHHLQSFSTNSNSLNNNKSAYFRVKNMLNSLKRYKDLLEGE